MKIDSSISTDKHISQTEAFNFLKHVWEGTPHAAIVADKDGVIIEGNQIATRIFGFSGLEMQGMPLSSLILSNINFNEINSFRMRDTDINCRNRNDYEFVVQADISRIFITKEKANFLLFILKEKLEQQQGDTYLIDRLKFEELISELSLRFINLPHDQIDSEIENGLYDILKHLNIERISLNQFFENQTELIQTHSICKTGNRPYLGKDLFKYIPWHASQFAKNEIMLFAGEATLPPEADYEKAYMTAEVVTSGMVFPLSIEGETLGTLILSSFQDGYIWKDELIQQMKIVSNVMANVLLRKKTQQELSEKHEYESLLIELSASFVHLDDNYLENCIYEWLDRTCNLLNIELGLFYTCIPERNSYELVPPSTKKVPKSCPTRIDQVTYRHIWAKLQSGDISTCLDLSSTSVGLAADMKRLKGDRFHSVICIPVLDENLTVGLLLFKNINCRKSKLHRLIQRLKIISEVIAGAILRNLSNRSLKSALDEIGRLNGQLEAERNYLKEEINLQHNHRDIVGDSRELQYTLYKVEQVAPTDTTVLIFGETGTGKELIARAIHNASCRCNKSLIKINCAALSPTLIESELFGHEKGAFTGAHENRIGRFELADGASLFLDEIGELPLELQPKLLRILQEGEFERLGSSKTRHVDVRIITATNRNLAEEVEKGRFRRDLWYRLNIFPITVPPLRKRRDDIPILVNRFVKRLSKKLGRSITSISSETIGLLQQHDWPGNIRELENVIERAMIHSKGSMLKLVENAEFIDPSTPSTTHPLKTLEESERYHILLALERTGGKIYGQAGAGAILGIHPETLRSRMKKLGIVKTHVSR